MYLSEFEQSGNVLVHLVLIVVVGVRNIFIFRK